MTLSQLREKILRVAFRAKEGHIPSALSILDIVYVLYNKIMHVQPSNPEWEERDRFILSKGHGCLALYVVLQDLGYFSEDVLYTFCQQESPLGGHPTRNLKYGIEASTGSLGHGLPMAVGVAMALKLKGNNSKVYCLIGDGECNEGSIYESIVLACEHGLNNLYIILDFNYSSVLRIPPLYHMGCELFGCIGDVEDTMNRALLGDHTRPKIIMVATKKGYGIKRMVDNPSEWHHKCPTEQELNEMIEQIHA